VLPIGNSAADARLGSAGNLNAWRALQPLPHSPAMALVRERANRSFGVDPNKLIARLGRSRAGTLALAGDKCAPLLEERSFRIRVNVLNRLDSPCGESNDEPALFAGFSGDCLRGRLAGFDAASWQKYAVGIASECKPRAPVSQNSVRARANDTRVVVAGRTKNGHRRPIDGRSPLLVAIGRRHAASVNCVRRRLRASPTQFSFRRAGGTSRRRTFL
jgi:hypothetical protein